VVWLKHRVRQMPADAHNVLWGMLRQQMVQVSIVGYHNSIAAQVGPTLGLFSTWAVRLLVAIALYRAVDRWLFPIYRPTRDRGPAAQQCQEACGRPRPLPWDHGAEQVRAQA